MAKSKEELKAEYPELFGKEHIYLAISGGGANGAFAAGLLAGSTASGSRPEFSIVTGVSTGALIAPFAMLGTEYDSLLKEFYTTYDTKDLIQKAPHRQFPDQRRDVQHEGAGDPDCEIRDRRSQCSSWLTSIARAGRCSSEPRISTPAGR